MEVRFKSGGTYQYGRVSEEAFRNLLMADSIGSHFHKNIRGNDAHPVSKVEEKET